MVCCMVVGVSLKRLGWHLALVQPQRPGLASSELLAPVARRGRSKAGGTEAAGVINYIYLRYENGEICSEAFGSCSGTGFFSGKIC